MKFDKAYETESLRRLGTETELFTGEFGVSGTFENNLMDSKWMTIVALAVMQYFINLFVFQNLTGQCKYFLFVGGLNLEQKWFPNLPTNYIQTIVVDIDWQNHFGIKHQMSKNFHNKTQKLAKLVQFR